MSFCAATTSGPKPSSGFDMMRKRTSGNQQKISPGRLFAYEALLKLNAPGSKFHSDSLLRTRALDKLAPVDRNLATTLVLGTLRWQLALDALIRPLLTRPNAKLDAEVLTALRLAAFQLTHLDRIPAHAAINESVALTHASGHKFAAGMVNAVLRKLAANAAESRALAPRDAYPEWLVGRWTNNFGGAITDAICLHGQQQPGLNLRLIAPDAESTLLAAGAELAPGSLLTTARRLINGSLPEAPESSFRIQDEGSQLVAEIAAALLPADASPQPRLLDACAAPGGKTLLLAERLPLAAITAMENSPPRLAELRQRMASHPRPLSSRISCEEADATEPFATLNLDLVLADVPCTGTGTLGRNPEIRHRLTPASLAAHAARQQKILSNALHALRPGGRLLYSTCSLEPEENQLAIDAALKSCPAEFMQLTLAPALDSLATSGLLHAHALPQLKAALTPAGALPLLPGQFNSDGFFICALERRVQ